jgi:hypothetical protein
MGPAATGEYALRALLKDKILWNRDGIIRVMRPNVGQSGLVQRMQATEEFHRPGDQVTFALQGSGFRPTDVGLLKAVVNDMTIERSTFVYLAPGRLELNAWVPLNARPGVYGMTISQGENTLLSVPKAFTVVGANWARGFRVDPALVPGGDARVVLMGRDLDAKFISKIKVEVDEPELVIGEFKWVSATEASASVKAGVNVKPGDYLLHLTVDGKPFTPQFGSIIQVSAKN